MLLSQVVDAPVERDVDIAGITYDSRQVGVGFLFCCLPGAVTDGHDFAAAAVGQGAVALLCERRVEGLDVAQVIVPDARLAMAPASARFWGEPATSLRMVGITGTNGKTTTVSMLEAMFAANGARATSLGTLKGARTTPEAPDLQALLASFRDDGIDTVAMEVSSNALVAARVDAIRFDVVGFTNLSHEHLDFHHTMEEYFAAKAQLFTPERARAAVICVDDDWGARLAGIAADRGLDVTRCSVRDAVLDGRDGVRARFRWNGATGTLQLAGRHNLANAVVAANVGELLGLSAQQALDGLAQVASVPGRFEPVDAGQPFTVVVDYAHTPAALEVALDAARGVVSGSGQVLIVVGCGGEKDRAKRPLMAAVSEAMADLVILTSDNPRREDPRAILEEMQSGLRDPSRVTVEVDRAAAIQMAVRAAAPGDVVLIAGKGHETTQTIGDAVIDFDDRAVARAAIAEVLG